MQFMTYTLLARAYLQRMPFSGERLDNFRPTGWLPSKVYDLAVVRFNGGYCLWKHLYHRRQWLGFQTPEQKKESTNIYSQLQSGLIPYDGLLIKDVYITTDSWMVDSLKERGFSLPSEPDMILENVTLFQYGGICCGIASQIRTKYNQVAERSKDLQVIDYSNWSEAPTEAMYPLYVNIMSAVDFYIQLMSPAYFQ